MPILIFHRRSFDAVLASFLISQRYVIRIFFQHTLMNFLWTIWCFWLFLFVLLLGLPKKMGKLENLVVLLCVSIPQDYCIWLSGWWFGTFFIFHNIWDNPSHWLIFFKMVKTTNQLLPCVFPIATYRAKESRWRSQVMWGCSPWLGFKLGTLKRNAPTGDIDP
jgi:hypothetical protein